MLRVFFVLIFAFSSIDAIAQNDYLVRVSSFPNDGIFLEVRFTPAKLEVLEELGVDTCLGSTCGNKFNLSADLTTIDGRLKDFALNRTNETAGPAKFHAVCTYVIAQPGNITVPDQHTSIFQAGLQHTGINSLHVLPGSDNKIKAAYFKKTGNPAIIAHALANVNKTNCNITGPAVVLYTVPDDEFQTSPKTYDRIVGAILKNSEGFEFYFADVLTKEVGEVKLNIPGGQAVNVISAALAIGPSAVSPRAAGIPTNRAFLIYRILRFQGTSFQTSILLQQMQLQGNSLTTIGAPKTIAPFTNTAQPGAETVQSVALGPDGNFALYTAFSPACGKEIVKYQKLHPNTGAKIGPATIVLDCAKFANSIVGAYGLDLIRITQ